MPCLTRLSAVSGVSLAAITHLCRGHGGVGGGGAHFPQSLGLGAGDLVLGELHAPLEMLRHRAAGLCRQLLGLLGGELDDGFRLLGCVALLAFIVGEHLLGFLAQMLGLVEVLGDRSGAGIESARELLVHAEIEQAAEEEEERYRDPEFRLQDEVHGSVFPRVLHGLLDLATRGDGADQLAHDVGGDVGRHRAHVLHGRGLGLVDARLGLRALLAKLLVELGALGRHLLFQLGAARIDDGMGLLLSLGERLLIGGDRLLGLAP